MLSKLTHVVELSAPWNPGILTHPRFRQENSVQSFPTGKGFTTVGGQAGHPLGKIISVLKENILYTG